MKLQNKIQVSERNGETCKIVSKFFANNSVKKSLPTARFELAISCLRDRRLTTWPRRLIDTWGRIAQLLSADQIRWNFNVRLPFRGVEIPRAANDPTQKHAERRKFVSCNLIFAQ